MLRRSVGAFASAASRSSAFSSGLATSSFARSSSLLSSSVTPSLASTSTSTAASISPLTFTNFARFFASYIEKMRNIGISAHIDSGKTTLSERILFYGGRIHAIHDVKGKDGVGAKMDNMDLEREKGITIQSAATYIKWQGDVNVNVIDTPGHVDFTIEVERSLRVLDGAVLVLCGVAGVQSQSITVDRQMRRYNVPRLAFINKLDRAGATPWKPINDLRKMLHLNAAAVQIPIGSESNFKGVVDIINRQAIYFEGPSGDDIKLREVPSELVSLMEEKRKVMIEALADADDEIGEYVINEEEPPVDKIKAAIRRQTIALKFVPVFMGSAFKNKGVQPLLDGVCDYLPNPSEVKNIALDAANNETPVEVPSVPDKPLVALAFKLEESRFGQLTYMRVYQGTLRKGDTIMNVVTGKKVKLPRLVRMHSNEMQDVNEAKAGDIVAMFGVDCHSGTTFTDGTLQYSMSPMRVPEPVISLAVRPKLTKDAGKFGKALNRFVKEDPTFRVHADTESGETIISGMGELHLEIYCERIKREYDCEVTVGFPQVNYREAITKKAAFNYLHKKQSGGSGQFGRVIGYIEPLPEDSPKTFEFVNALSGNNIPPEFVNPITKGFEEAIAKGPNTGCPIERVRVVLEDGASHSVDSNEIAFRLAAIGGFKQAFEKAGPIILEPVMGVQIEIPDEFQGSVVGEITRRKGMIANVESRGDGYCVVDADVPLSKMFGYATDLRSMTQGKGEFTMTYKSHMPMASEEAADVTKKYRATLSNKEQDD